MLVFSSYNGDMRRSRQQQEKAAQKARRAEIKQLVEQNKLPKLTGDDLYNFLDGKNIRRIPVNPEMRQRLGAAPQRQRRLCRAVYAVSSAHFFACPAWRFHASARGVGGRCCGGAGGAAAGGR